jgi:hypothetical protein
MPTHHVTLWGGLPVPLVVYRSPGGRVLDGLLVSPRGPLPPVLDGPRPAEGREKKVKKSDPGPLPISGGVIIWSPAHTGSRSLGPVRKEISDYEFSGAFYC